MTDIPSSPLSLPPTYPPHQPAPSQQCHKHPPPCSAQWSSAAASPASSATPPSTTPPSPTPRCCTTSAPRSTPAPSPTRSGTSPPPTCPSSSRRCSTTPSAAAAARACTPQTSHTCRRSSRSAPRSRSRKSWTHSRSRSRAGRSRRRGKGGLRSCCGRGGGWMRMMRISRPPTSTPAVYHCAHHHHHHHHAAPPPRRPPPPQKKKKQTRSSPRTGPSPLSCAGTERLRCRRGWRACWPGRRPRATTRTGSTVGGMGVRRWRGDGWWVGVGVVPYCTVGMLVWSLVLGVFLLCSVLFCSGGALVVCAFLCV